MDKVVKAMIDSYICQLNAGKGPEDDGYREPSAEYMVITRDKGIFIMPLECYQKLGVRKRAKLESGANEIYRVKWERHTRQPAERMKPEEMACAKWKEHIMARFNRVD